MVGAYHDSRKSEWTLKLVGIALVLEVEVTHRPNTQRTLRTSWPKLHWETFLFPRLESTSHISRIQQSDILQ